MPSRPLAATVLTSYTPADTIDNHDIAAAAAAAAAERNQTAQPFNGIGKKTTVTQHPHHQRQ
jgi:hypothetical protein